MDELRNLKALKNINNKQNKTVQSLSFYLIKKMDISGNLGFGRAV